MIPSQNTRPFRFKVSTSTVCVLLAALTLLCYWPVLSSKFVCFDDEHYLFDSGYVAKGLTWSGSIWALRTGYFSNWHPLTWLSFMLDAQIYGMSPAGFHSTNLFFHIANSVLLFLVLKSMTQRFWPSAIAAALFAWHPLHVESVAWVSERKDVLSTFFFLLTLFSFWRYVKERESSMPDSNRVSRYYLLSLLFFMLALMSKQMVVTLPCVLLLLDFWPLNRISLDTAKRGNLSSNALVLLREKLPFFALAFVASAVTFAVQDASGAVSSVANNPIRYRIANALLGYVAYLADSFWPAHLSVVYPVFYNFSLAAIAGCALLLVAASAFVVFRARQNPFLPVGWFWFVGTLVPVIGLIQVGSQSRADRYMYIPSIGLSIALIWGIDALFELGSRRRKEAGAPSEPGTTNPVSLHPRLQLFRSWMQWCSSRRFQILAPAAIVVLAACLFCARVHVGYWHDSEKLFRHAIAVTQDNYMAYNCLSKALEELNHKEESIQCLREAVRLAPGYAGAQYNLGTVLLLQGKLDEALPHLKAAAQTSPKDASTHQNLGHIYFVQGNLREAIAEYAEAVALDPENTGCRVVLGLALLKQSRWTEAALVLSGAVTLDPTNADAKRGLGVALLNQGKSAEAIQYLSEAIRMQPANSDSRFNYGVALLAQNQTAQAVAQFAECLRLSPTDARGHYLMAMALSKLHNLKEAVFHYREALRMNPEFADVLNDFALLLACTQDAGLRDGKEAVKLAEKACAITNHQQANMLTTLAAAYAEVGRFQDATAAAQIACNLATSNGQSAVAAKAGELLELSQSGRPLRE